jgi:hypothetical protein
MQKGGGSRGVFDGVARGLGCAPGSPILCLVPFSSLPARLARSSKQSAAWLHCYAKIWRSKWAAPSGALGGFPARDVSTFCRHRPPLPPTATAHHYLLPPQRRTSTRGLTAGTRSWPPESRGGVRALDSPLVDLDEAHHRGRRHRSCAPASLRACFIPPCCRRGRSRLTATRGARERERENGMGRAAEEAAGGGGSSLAAAQHPALQQPTTFIDMRKCQWGKWCRCWTISS